MRPIASRIDTGSAQYAANRDAYRELVATLRERMQWAIDGGDGRARSIERHLARGKVMVRDRIDMVIDEGTPFLELSTLSGWGQYGNSAPGAGIVTGIGIVHRTPYVFIANDATVKGGSLLPVSIKKHVRAYVDREIADSERITAEGHRHQRSLFNRIKWGLCYFIVATMDYNVSRRLNFGIRGG